MDFNKKHKILINILFVIILVLIYLLFYSFNKNGEINKDIFTEFEAFESKTKIVKIDNCKIFITKFMNEEKSFPRYFFNCK